ncbi:MAG: GlxA family transcriptional regulator [Candidatus Obscuribacterales bacterium]|nr:GlxA family transcriptional regulator [Candidatus Obscuribacterales bacterium]
MRKIVFLMPDNSQLLDFAGPHDVFTAANQALKHQHTDTANLYKLILVGEDSIVPIDGGQGLNLVATSTLDSFKGAIDTLIVVGGQKLNQNRNAHLIQWIQKASRRARRIVSICTGAFLLAEAGILNDRKAVTHWLFCDELASRFPRISVNSKTIYVKDENVYTSAGVTAGIDLCLALVEEDHGRSASMTVARGLVVSSRRNGSQEQFSFLLRNQFNESDAFSDLLSWMQKHLKSDLTVEMLAEHCSMSSRNFSRRFSETFGASPARFVERLRLDRAKTLLTETDQSIDQIAHASGFSNVDIFRKSFRRHLKMTPGDYRKTWSG